MKDTLSIEGHASMECSEHMNKMNVIINTPLNKRTMVNKKPTVSTAYKNSLLNDVVSTSFSWRKPI